jgi:hypothetical protein
MTGLGGLNLHSCDLTSWFSSVKVAPPALESLYLVQCTVPSDLGAFARQESLEEIVLYRCMTEEGEPLTTLDVPGVRALVA